MPLKTQKSTFNWFEKRGSLQFPLFFPCYLQANHCSFIDINNKLRLFYFTQLWNLCSPNFKKYSTDSCTWCFLKRKGRFIDGGRLEYSLGLDWCW